jgi:hypothetical protein
MIKTLRIKLVIGFLLTHLIWIPTEKANAEDDDPNRFVAMAMAGMITDIIIDPKKNVVQKFAAVMEWESAPEHIKLAGDADEAYYHHTQTTSFVVASKESGGFSISIHKNFDAKKFWLYFSEIAPLINVGSDEVMGQKNELKIVHDRKSPNGLISVVYGTTTLLEGTGTVGFIPWTVLTETGMDQRLKPLLKAIR